MTPALAALTADDLAAFMCRQCDARQADSLVEIGNVVEPWCQKCVSKPAPAEDPAVLALQSGSTVRMYKGFYDDPGARPIRSRDHDSNLLELPVGGLSGR